MIPVPPGVLAEARADVDQRAAESRMLLATDEATRFAVESIADVIAALGHPGAGRVLADAGYVVTQMSDSLSRVTGQEFDAEEALALLGMAGLVLAGREQEAAR